MTTVLATRLAAVSTKYPKAAMEVGPKIAATPLIGDAGVAPVEQVNWTPMPVPAAMLVVAMVEPQASTKGLRVLVSTAINAREVDCATVEMRAKVVVTVTVLVKLMSPPAKPKRPIPLMVVLDRVETVVDVTVEEPTVRVEEASPEIAPAVEVKDVVVMVVETVIDIAAVPDICRTVLTVTTELTATNMVFPPADSVPFVAMEEPVTVALAPSSPRSPAVTLLPVPMERLLALTFS